MMKKTLVALAATAATGAFAQVAITGTIDLGIQSRDAQDTTAKFVGLTKNSTTTSVMGFTGTEDLGGGLKAGFKLEWTLTPEASSSLNSAAQTLPAASGSFFSGAPFNSEQFVSLSGDWGTVKAGEPNAAVFRAQGVSQPLGTGLGSGYHSTTFSRLGYAGGYGIGSFMGNANGSGTTMRVIRAQKTIQYETPVMNGFSAMGEYSFANDNKTSLNASNTPTWVGLLVNYSAGPLNLAAAYNKYSAGTNGITGNVNATGTATGLTLTTIALAANNDITYQFVGANYTVGQNTFYAGYSNVRASNATEDSQSWNVAYKFAATANLDLSANMVSAQSSLAGGTNLTFANGLTASTNNLNRKMIGLGADYRLSKRTALFARYESVDSNTDNTASGEANITAFGVRHQF
jgi:predicted porin